MSWRIGSLRGGKNFERAIRLSDAVYIYIYNQLPSFNEKLACARAPADVISGLRAQESLGGSLIRGKLISNLLSFILF